MGDDATTAVVEQLIDGVGPRLRALRRRRDTTLEELSKTTGISASTLSRLEGGKRRPTLELLMRLALAHRVPLDDLVGAPPIGDPRIHIRPAQRNGQTVMSLTRRPGGIQAQKIIIPVGSEPALDSLQTHEGYEWLYVLNGRLRLVLGDQELVLVPGEVAEFDTHVPHWLGPAGDVAVELLVLFGQQGERARPRVDQGL